LVRHDPTARLQKRLPRYCFLFHDVLLATKESSKKYAVKEPLVLTNGKLTDLSHDQKYPPFSFEICATDADGNEVKVRI
jgi:hypothetical protein